MTITRLLEIRRRHYPARLELFVDRSEISRLQKYLRDTFRLDTITLRERTQKDDSCEVYIGDEFIGVVFKDDEDDEISYAFQMAILEIDLPVVAGLSDD